MKKKNVIIAIIIIVLALLVIGYFVLTHFMSNYMFDEDGLHFQTKKDSLIELRTIMDTSGQTEEEKNEFVNTCLEQGQITQEEADFLLGVTDEI